MILHPIKVTEVTDPSKNIFDYDDGFKIWFFIDAARWNYINTDIPIRWR